jgi:hypothetical protein
LKTILLFILVGYKQTKHVLKIIINGRYNIL